MFVVHHEREVPVQFPLELRARLIPNVRCVALLARDDQARRAIQAVLVLSRQKKAVFGVKERSLVKLS